MSSSKSTEPIRPAKSSTSRKSIVSSAMSDEEVITLKVEIDNTARAVASTRGEFKILGSVISAYTSQHPDSVELKDLWNMSDSVHHFPIAGSTYSNLNSNPRCTTKRHRGASTQQPSLLLVPNVRNFFCPRNSIKLSAMFVAFLTKCGSFKSSTLPIETRQKIIASFLTVSYL